MHHTDTDLPNCPGHHTEDTPGNPVWCHNHATRIHTALTGLPAAYRQLATTEALDTGRRQILRAPSPEPASPSRRMDYADVILRDLCRWEDDLRQKLRHPAAKHEASHTTNALDAAVAYLTRHHTAALNAPGAVDYGHEITALARTAHKLLGTGDEPTKPTRTYLAGPCPDCRYTKLYRVDGRDQVGCATSGCHVDMTYDEYLGHMWWLSQAYEGAA